MTEIDIPQGEQRVIDGQVRVYYDGYWIKKYDVPADTLLAKKRLIEALTQRLFNHVEYGLNVPGTRLTEARRAFLDETDQAKKRVKGGMLAGALTNRATDIFTKLVELQACGVEIQPDNALMRQCGEHLQESLALGKMVLHRSGEEGIDELWGEPFKAFAFPIEEFYKSRYVKIALTMRAIDAIGDALRSTIAVFTPFGSLTPVVDDFVRAAKLKTETLRTDVDVFEVWSSWPARPYAISSRRCPAPRASISSCVCNSANSCAPVRCWSRPWRAPAYRCRRVRMPSSNAANTSAKRSRTRKMRRRAPAASPCRFWPRSFGSPREFARDSRQLRCPRKIVQRARLLQVVV
jgi:hypothetical protein